jgi:hypothetical protein
LSGSTLELRSASCRCHHRCFVERTQPDHQNGAGRDAPRQIRGLVYGKQTIRPRSRRRPARPAAGPEFSVNWSRYTCLLRQQPPCAPQARQTNLGKSHLEFPARSNLVVHCIRPRTSSNVIAPELIREFFDGSYAPIATHIRFVIEASKSSESLRRHLTDSQCVRVAGKGVSVKRDQRRIFKRNQRLASRARLVLSVHNS